MAASVSPITGVINENEVILEFSKYLGKTIRDVADLDKDFYNKLVEEKEKGTFSIRRHRDKSFRLQLNPLADVEA